DKAAGVVLPVVQLYKTDNALNGLGAEGFRIAMPGVHDDAQRLLVAVGTDPFEFLKGGADAGDTVFTPALAVIQPQPHRLSSLEKGHRFQVATIDQSAHPCAGS